MSLSQSQLPLIENKLKERLFPDTPINDVDWTTISWEQLLQERSELRNCLFRKTSSAPVADGDSKIYSFESLEDVRALLHNNINLLQANPDVAVWCFYETGAVEFLEAVKYPATKASLLEDDIATWRKKVKSRLEESQEPWLALMRRHEEDIACLLYTFARQINDSDLLDQLLNNAIDGPKFGRPVYDSSYLWRERVFPFKNSHHEFLGASPDHLQDLVQVKSSNHDDLGREVKLGGLPSSTSLALACAAIIVLHVSAATSILWIGVTVVLAVILLVMAYNYYCNSQAFEGPAVNVVRDHCGRLPDPELQTLRDAVLKKKDGLDSIDTVAHARAERIIYAVEVELDGWLSAKAASVWRNGRTFFGQCLSCCGESEVAVDSTPSLECYTQREWKCGC